jgi:hypothetical protein
VSFPPLFASLITLVEQGAHDPELPGTAVRVQCLHYAATLLEHAAALVAGPTLEAHPTPCAGGDFALTGADFSRRHG